MKRLFLLAAICLAGIQSLVAQRFTHGAGIGFFAEDAKVTKEKSGVTLTYSPRLSFAETNNTSLSVGIPLIAGLAGTYEGFYESDGNYNGNTITYTILVPLMLNFNIGAGSARNCEDKMGYFIGTGYAYHVGSVFETLVNQSGYEYSKSNTRSSTGLAANIGIRIGVGYKRRHNIEIRALYMKGLTSYRPSFLDLGCLFNF